MIGFVSSPKFVEHATGPHHPERPDRIRAIHRALRLSGLLSSPDPFPEFEIDLSGIAKPTGIQLIEIEPKPATEQHLRLVHEPKVIERARRVCESGGGVLDLGDTPVGKNSYEIALLSCGSALTACDAVMSGRVKRAFSASRPPGHHAEPDRSMGFCLFNNIAVAARHLQKSHGIERVAIVDFDVHHGNGTHAAFEDDPSVLFISLHQHPRTCYPGSGYDYETGTGSGEGFTLNIPMQPGSDDSHYHEAFDALVIPRLDQFKPQFLLISTGFDAHREDPLAHIELSDECFEWMTRQLCQIADQHSGDRAVSMLEGGYNLGALGRSVVRHISGLE